MNYSTAVFLINDAVRAIACTYEAGDTAPRTIFKTFDQSIKVDDFVLVPTDTRHKMTVCKVVEVDVEPDLESSIQMAWIVGIVDREGFENILEQEKAAIDAMKSAEKNRRREELRKSMMANVDTGTLSISHVKDVG